jgi:hypothetical protein
MKKEKNDHYHTDTGAGMPMPYAHNIKLNLVGVATNNICR